LLWLVGEVIGAITRRRPAPDLVGLLLLAVLGSAACLANPWGVRGLTLPVELGLFPGAAELRDDPVLRSLFLTPFDSAYWQSGLGLSIAGLSWLLLVGVGLFSFFTAPGALRSWRLPVWLGFLGLAAWRVRTVPFFAIAAAPVLAFNLQELFSSAPVATAPRARLLFSIGRVWTLLALVVLTAVAWPGWLQGLPHEARRWSVSTDASLERTAEHLEKLHRGGLLTPPAAVFALSPEAANSLAWLAPGQHTFFNGRFAGPVADYVRVRRTLLGMESNAEACRKALRAHGVRCVVVHDLDADRRTAVFLGLVNAPGEWTLLALDGRAAVFGWRDPAGGPPPAWTGLDLRSRAFRPGPDQQAPADGPPRLAAPPAVDSAFVGRAEPSAERDAAAYYLAQFDSLLYSFLAQHYFLWEHGLLAGAVGAAAAAMPGPALVSALECEFFRASHLATAQGKRAPLETAALDLKLGYHLQQDDGPPGLLLLAVRAARRAVAANPDDPQAYRVLGETYLRMARSTRERAWRYQMPYLSRLRQIQATAAFTQALALQPDSVPVHNSLADFYHDLRYLDLELRHRQQVLRSVRHAGPRPGETQEQAQTRIDRLEDTVRQLKQQVDGSLDRFEVNASQMKVIDRADMALRRQLAGKALEVLLAQKDLAGAAGRAGAELELNLLLTVGRVREAQDWLTPDVHELLGDYAYKWIRVQVAAALGKYAEADEGLAAMTPSGQIGELTSGPINAREAIAITVAEAVLRTRIRDPHGFHGFHMRLDQPALEGRISEMVEVLRRHADLSVFRAYLALEWGQSRRAEELLRDAMLLVKTPAGAIDFASRPIAEYLLEQLSAAP
jgi:hypothetical protein